MFVIADKYCLFLKRGRLMDDIRKYLLSIIASAIISAAVIRICGQKGMISAMIKLLAGIFMSITVISPLLKLQIGNFSEYLGALEIETDCYVDEAEDAAAIERSAFITEKLESYILDKATSLGMSIEVEVELSDSVIQLPNQVRITGEVSPYNKQRLQQIIENDLGIPEENQLWI